jgi:hypothetical protein
LFSVAAHATRELKSFCAGRVRRAGFISFGLLILMAAIFFSGQALAGQLRLNWQDASSDEEGFKIERKSGRGKYRVVALTGADVTAYVDAGLKGATTYCYRVRAYKEATHSDPSNPACGKTHPDLTIHITGSGAGAVISVPGGIDCGVTCAAGYPEGTLVTLVPIPFPGSSFAGWKGRRRGGGDCKDAMVTMNTNKTCTAVFKLDPMTQLLAATSASTSARNTSSAAAAAIDGAAGDAAQGLPSSIGVFRPGTGEWFLDTNGRGVMDACRAIACLGPLGKKGDVPVAGSWTVDKTFVGVFDPKAASWSLDLNGNGVLDGCEARACRHTYGAPGDLPVVGDWTGEGKTKIGVFRPALGEWHLDIDGDGDFEGCDADACVRVFGAPGDLPVTGDWNGDGKTKIGVFRPALGEWLLDLDGDGQDEGKSCAGECIAFGAAGDLPVVGDWDGNGVDKIGVFRPSTGEWFLDLNGDGKWNGCKVDLCLGPFGRPGDLPVVGKWM